MVDNGKGKKHSTLQGRRICFSVASGTDGDGSCGSTHCQFEDTVDAAVMEGGQGTTSASSVSAPATSTRTSV